MRGAGDDGDLLAFEPLRQRILDRRIAPGHETRRRAVIRIGEIDLGAHFRRRRDRGDCRIALVAVERRNERLEAAHLDGAGDLELLAHHARQIDVEALRVAVRAGEIERRIVGLGEETDHADARQIGFLRPAPRIPEAGHAHRRRGGRWRPRCGAGSATASRHGENRRDEQQQRRSSPPMQARSKYSGTRDLYDCLGPVLGSKSHVGPLCINEAVKADQWRRDSPRQRPGKDYRCGRLHHKYRRRSATAASVGRLRLKGDTKRPVLSMRYTMAVWSMV